MKKVLILTVTAGNGHNACAAAMKEKLESLPDVEVKVVDMMKEYSSPLLGWVVNQGYSLTAAHFLTLYNCGYENFRKADPNRRYGSGSQLYSVSTVEGLYEEIWNFRPDVIYATHFYGAMAITDLKLLGALPAKTFVSCLDFINSPFWEAGIGVDYMWLPSAELKEMFLNVGYSESQLVYGGMPVSEKFSHCLTKSEAREKLGLEKDKFTVLLIFGGGLWSGADKIFKQLVKALDFPANIIKINGRDKRGYKRTARKIASKRFPKNISVTNIAFTDDVAYYMTAADCVVSKMGGPSATECINSGTPVVVTEKLTQQEVYNLKFMKEHGCALSFSDGKELSKHIHTLHEHPETLQAMEENCRKLQDNGVEKLAELIMQQPQAIYDEKDRLPTKGLKRRVKKALKAADKQCKKQAHKNK